MSIIADNIQQIRDELSGYEGRIIAVSKYVDAQKMHEAYNAGVRDFAESKKFTMPFASDPNREIYKLYAVNTIPRNIIIGENGRIIFQNMGYNEEEFKKIEVLLAEKLK